MTRRAIPFPGRPLPLSAPLYASRRAPCTDWIVTPQDDDVWAAELLSQVDNGTTFRDCVWLLHAAYTYHAEDENEALEDGDGAAPFGDSLMMAPFLRPSSAGTSTLGSADESGFHGVAPGDKRAPKGRRKSKVHPSEDSEDGADEDALGRSGAYQPATRGGSDEDFVPEHTTASERQKKLDRANEEERDRMMGKDLIYGKKIQLYHVKSGQFLTVDEEHGSVFLHPTGTEGSWFALRPRYRTRKEGETVRANDEIVLQSWKWRDFYLHFNENTLNLYEEKRTEVQGITTFAHATSWRVGVFSPFTHDEDALRAHQVIRLWHKEQETELMATSDGSVRLAARTDNQSNSNSWWLLEFETEYRGGLVAPTDLVRLKHLGTLKYLTVSEIEYDPEATAVGAALALPSAPHSGDLRTKQVLRLADDADDAVLFQFKLFDGTINGVGGSESPVYGVHERQYLRRFSMVYVGFQPRSEYDYGFDLASFCWVHATDSVHEPGHFEVVGRDVMHHADVFEIIDIPPSRVTELSLCSSLSSVLEEFCDNVRAEIVTDKDKERVARALETLILFCISEQKNATLAMLDKEVVPIVRRQNMLSEQQVTDLLVRVLSYPFLEANYGTTCGICGEKPIVGIRHSSSSREDFDVCDACYSKTDFGAEVFQTVLPPAAVHTKVMCDACGMYPLVGTRYTCVTCPEIDLCSTCREKPKLPKMADGLNHLTTHKYYVRETPSDPKRLEEVHGRDIICDGCGMCPIRGPRFTCTMPKCDQFDFCKNCVVTEKHASIHRFKRIPLEAAEDVLIEGAEDDPDVMYKFFETIRLNQLTRFEELKRVTFVPKKKGDGPSEEQAETALHVAAYWNRPELLAQMVAVSAVDVYDVDGKTPLIVAAAAGSAECVRLLLDAKADLGLADKQGRQAIHAAAAEGQLACVEMLVAHKKELAGVVVDTTLPNGSKRAVTPADLAVIHRRRRWYECKVALETALGLAPVQRLRIGGPAPAPMLVSPMVRGDKLASFQSDHIYVLAFFSPDQARGDSAFFSGLSAIQGKYGKDNVVVVAVTDETANSAELSSVLAEHAGNINFRIASDLEPAFVPELAGSTAAKPKHGRTWWAYSPGLAAGVDGPFAAVVDRDGKLFWAGRADEERLGEAVELATDTSGARRLKWKTALYRDIVDMVPAELISEMYLRNDDPRSAMLFSRQNDAEGNSPLHLASRVNHVALIETLLAIKVMPNVENNAQLTPVHAAASHGAVEALAMLLDAGARGDALDGGLQTPLHLAARGGWQRCVALLAKSKGVNVNAVNRGGFTALVFAVSHAERQGENDQPFSDERDCYVTSSAILLNNGANNNLDLGSHGSILHLAKQDQAEWYRLIDMLTGKSDMEVNRTDDRGRTPLHIVVQRGWFNCAELLLLRGAGESLVVCDQDGLSPAETAMSLQDTELEKLLAEHEKSMVSVSAEKLQRCVERGVCTFALSSDGLVEQDFFGCETCNIECNEDTGFCAACRVVAHKGHKVTGPRTAVMSCNTREAMEKPRAAKYDLEDIQETNPDLYRICVLAYTLLGIICKLNPAVSMKMLGHVPFIQSQLQYDIQSTQCLSAIFAHRDILDNISPDRIKQFVTLLENNGDKSRLLNFLSNLSTFTTDDGVLGSIPRNQASICVQLIQARAKLLFRTTIEKGGRDAVDDAAAADGSIMVRWYETRYDEKPQPSLPLAELVNKDSAGHYAVILSSKYKQQAGVNKQLGDFYEKFVNLLWHLCLGRNATAHALLLKGKDSPGLTFNITRRCVHDDNLPLSIRTEFCYLLIHGYLNRRPQQIVTEVTYTYVLTELEGKDKGVWKKPTEHADFPFGPVHEYARQQMKIIAERAFPNGRGSLYRLRTDDLKFYIAILELNLYLAMFGYYGTASLVQELFNNVRGIIDWRRDEDISPAEHTRKHHSRSGTNLLVMKLKMTTLRILSLIYDVLLERRLIELIHRAQGSADPASADVESVFNVLPDEAKRSAEENATFAAALLDLTMHDNDELNATAFRLLMRQSSQRQELLQAASERLQLLEKDDDVRVYRRFKKYSQSILALRETQYMVPERRAKFPEQIHRLPFAVVDPSTYPAGDTDRENVVTNLVLNDKSVYTANVSKNAEVVFRLDRASDDDRAVVTHVIVRAPRGYAGCVRTGLVFVSDTEPEAAETVLYDDFDSRKYAAYLEATPITAGPEPISGPVAFFHVDEDVEDVEVQLEVPKRGRFVVVKFLTQASRTREENIDVEHVGLVGFLVDGVTPEPVLHGDIFEVGRKLELRHNNRVEDQPGDLEQGLTKVSALVHELTSLCVSKPLEIGDTVSFFHDDLPYVGRVMTVDKTDGSVKVDVLHEMISPTNRVWTSYSPAPFVTMTLRPEKVQPLVCDTVVHGKASTEADWFITRDADGHSDNQFVCIACANLCFQDKQVRFAENGSQYCHCCSGKTRGEALPADASERPTAIHLEAQRVASNIGMHKLVLNVLRDLDSQLLEVEAGANAGTNQLAGAKLIQKLEDSFRLEDEDDSGELDTEEFRSMFRKLIMKNEPGLIPRTIAKICFGMIDEHAKKVAMSKATARLEPDAVIQEVVKQFARQDRAGELPPTADFLVLVEHLMAENHKYETLMREADTDGTGTISLEEYIEFMTTHVIDEKRIRTRAEVVLQNTIRSTARFLVAFVADNDDNQEDLRMHESYFWDNLNSDKGFEEVLTAIYRNNEKLCRDVTDEQLSMLITVTEERMHPRLLKLLHTLLTVNGKPIASNQLRIMVLLKQRRLFRADTPLLEAKNRVKRLQKYAKENGVDADGHLMFHRNMIALLADLASGDDNHQVKVFCSEVLDMRAVAEIFCDPNTLNMLREPLLNFFIHVFLRADAAKTHQAPPATSTHVWRMIEFLCRSRTGHLSLFVPLDPADPRSRAGGSRSSRNDSRARVVRTDSDLNSEALPPPAYSAADLRYLFDTLLPMLTQFYKLLSKAGPMPDDPVRQAATTRVRTTVTKLSSICESEEDLSRVTECVSAVASSPGQHKQRLAEETISSIALAAPAQLKARLMKHGSLQSIASRIKLSDARAQKQRRAESVDSQQNNGGGVQLSTPKPMLGETRKSAAETPTSIPPLLSKRDGKVPDGDTKLSPSLQAIWDRLRSMLALLASIGVEDVDEAIVSGDKMGDIELNQLVELIRLHMSSVPKFVHQISEHTTLTCDKVTALRVLGRMIDSTDEDIRNQLLVQMDAFGASTLVWILAGQGGNELLDESLRLGIKLLTEIDDALVPDKAVQRVVQRSMYKCVRETREEAFFAAIHHELNKIDLCDPNTARSEDEEEEDDINLWTTEVLILQFLQLLCEGHYINFQNYLRAQTLNTNSFNLINQAAAALHRPLRIESLDIKSCRELLETLSEFLQGPNFENQELLAESQLLRSLNQILEWRYKEEGWPVERGIRFFTLQGAACTCMLSMLESNHDGFIAQQIVASLNPDGLEATINEINELQLRRDLGDLLEEEENDQYSLTSVQSNVYILLTKLADHREDFAEAHERLNHPVFRRLQDRIGQIEVVGAHVEGPGKNQLERIYFQIPPLCNYLEKGILEEIKWNVARDTHDNKLSDFFQHSEQAIAGMYHNKFLAANQLLGSLISHLEASKLLLFLNALLLNCFILATYEFRPRTEYPYYTTIVDEDSIWLIFRLLCVVQLLGSTIMVGVFMVSSGPLIIRKKWRKRDNRHTFEPRVTNPLAVRWKQRNRNPVGDLVITLLFAMGSPKILYHVAYLVTAILGVIWSPFFFFFHLFEIVNRLKHLDNVIKAVKLSVPVIAHLMLLLFAVVYALAIIAFVYYQEYYVTEDGDRVCFSLWGCWINNMNNVLTMVDSMGDVLAGIVWTDTQRVVLHWGLFITFGMFFSQVILGVIVDNFAKLREDRDAILEDMATTCFICGLSRSAFEHGGNEGQELKKSFELTGFERHVKLEHNMWAYMYFLAYLEDKPPDENTGIEDAIWAAIKQIEPDFSALFPKQRALAIGGGAAEGDESTAKHHGPGSDDAASAAGASRSRMSRGGDRGADKTSNGDLGAKIHKLEEALMAMDAKLSQALGNSVSRPATRAGGVSSFGDAGRQSSLGAMMPRSSRPVQASKQASFTKPGATVTIPEEERADAPSLELHARIKGNVVHVGRDHSKLYIVFLWSTFSAESRAVLGRLSELHRKFPQVEILAVTKEWDRPESVEAFVAMQGDKMNYSIATCQPRPFDRYMALRPGSDVPLAVVIARGQVAWFGSVDKALDQAVCELLIGGISTCTKGVRPGKPVAVWQDVYRCKTCNSEVCSRCATSCHARHDIDYEDYGAFACGCGALCNIPDTAVRRLEDVTIQ